MKNNNTAGLLGIIIILILIVMKFDFIHYSSDDGYDLRSYYIADNKMDSINREVNKAKNKLNDVNNAKRKLIGNLDRYEGTTFAHVGVFDGFTYDFKGISRGSIKKHDQTSYLVLSKIGLAINEIHGKSYLAYYTKNGKGYLSRTKLTKAGKEYTVNFVDTPVPYSYSSDRNVILMPLNSAFWRICVYAVGYALSVVVLLTSLFIIVSFVKFLLAIAKNNIFDKGNIQRLRDMSIALLGLGLINYVINVLIYLIFSFIYPTDGVIITYSFLEYDYLVLIAAILCYFIYIAFKKGMILQQESELTI